MALPLSGNITSTMILAELGFTSPSDVLRNVIQKSNGRLQVMVNNVWVNLNMCSPYLPSEVSPFVVAEDWYGYNNRAAGVTAVSISGNTTVSEGDTVTYTATLQGTTFSNAVITWYKLENNVWSGALGTGTSISITWQIPLYARIKAVVSNNCSGVTVETERNISWACTPPDSASITGTRDIETGAYVTYYMVSQNGSNTALELTWIKTGPIVISSGQGTNAVTVHAQGAGPASLTLKVSNFCGIVYSNVQDINITNPTVTYQSEYRSANITKQGCPSGTTPETVFVEAYTGQFTSNESVAKANEIRDVWMNTQAQNNGQCFVNTQTYYSEYWHGFKQRNNCPAGYTGGWASLTATAGQFTSTVNVTDANAQRDTWLQNQANTTGVGCFNYNPTECGFQVSDLVIVVADESYSGSPGTNPLVPWAATITVSAAGTYTVKGWYGNEANCFWQSTMSLSAGSNSILGGALSLNGLNASMPGGGQYFGPLKVRVSSSCSSLEKEAGYIVYTYTP